MPTIGTTGDPMPTVITDIKETPEKVEDGVDDYDGRVPN